MKLSTPKTLVLTALMLITSLASAGKNNIDIVGSSTVYPFSTVAAERFSQATGHLAPKIESTGSGGGMKLFCKGIGANTPDVTNSSRRIKKSEQKLCAKNGVNDILEVKIGYDGIVIAQSLDGKSISLTRKELFLALGMTASIDISAHATAARVPPTIVAEPA
jgi:phosphate transport system substrate-binding protein